MSEPMPTRYHSTVSTPIIVHITCERCSHTYSTSQELEARASIALNPNAAAATAREILAQQLERMRLGDCSALDGAPCPKCGYEQHWMLETRARSNQQVGAYVGAALAGAPLIALGLTGRLGPSMPLAVLIAVLGAVAGYLLARALVGWWFRPKLAATKKHAPHLPTPELASMAKRAARIDPQA